jgi:hypothetical protein
MLFKDIIVLYSENHTKPINAKSKGLNEVFKLKMYETAQIN